MYGVRTYKIHARRMHIQGTPHFRGRPKAKWKQACRAASHCIALHQTRASPTARNRKCLVVQIVTENRRKNKRWTTEAGKKKKKAVCEREREEGGKGSRPAHLYRNRLHDEHPFPFASLTLLGDLTLPWCSPAHRPFHINLVDKLRKNKRPKDRPARVP